MNKTTTYIIAVLACIAYIILFSLTLVLFGSSFERLGIFWKILFLGLPVFGLWRWITSLAKKEKKNDM